MHVFPWRQPLIFLAALTLAAASDEAIAFGVALGIPAVVVGAVLSESHRILATVTIIMVCIGILGVCAHVAPRAGFLPKNMVLVTETEQVGETEQERARRAILRSEEAKKK
mmetsp:Transcript_53789/g.99431  ORF Transcript_53789/g.99431 Transcript_53789/m.99431 type:complete len:111 (-) Transcript_53789:203-535(-)